MQTITPQGVAVPIKYCLYARKSTEDSEKQILSIDSQIKEMLQLAERDHLEIVEIKKESHSAKETGQRPVFNELITDIQQQKFNGILTWAPDRISRNAGDLGRVVDFMDQGILKEIRTYSQRFTNNPNEKFLLMILGSQAKLENDNKSVNVKRGMRARVEMGLWPGIAPLGYSNEKHIDKRCHVSIDRVRAPIVRQMFEKVAYERKSGRDLYNWLLHEIHFKTRGGKSLSLGGIYRVLDSTFYYGHFEYPKESGNWYEGKHQPIITKELFKKAQEQLKRGNILRENREFSFTKLFTCGLCGSGITAEEKYKELKNGTTSKYVYYGCTRAKDRNCKNQYIREEELISELLHIIDQVDINELGMRAHFEDEIRRFNLLQKVVNKKSSITLEDTEINIREYAKYLLKEGSVSEKRSLLGNLRSKLVYVDKKIKPL